MKISSCKLRSFVFAILSLSMVFPILFAAHAHAETRSLKLYFIHTREKAEIVFKRDGKYDQDGLKRLNVFLRDWRRNEPTNMDPRLFDLIWAVYKASGSRDYINVVSAYRSPATNNMLRSRSKNSGVAQKSQHTLGRAMDFFLPDVNLAKLRAVGMKQQGGGVGYYPKSGSPFIHMDIGNVRHWPRMTRKELMALFPDGKTMHVPTDGKAFSGYAQAKAEWETRKNAPIVVAKNTGGSQKKGLFASLFGKSDKQEQPTPAPVRVATAQPIIAQAVPANVSLPQNDAPLPELSPLRNAQNKGDDIPALINEPEETNTPLVAYTATAIPVPSLKPDTGDDLTNNETVIASIPMPEKRPHLENNNNDNNRQTNIVVNEPKDEIGSLIADNSQELSIKEPKVALNTTTIKTYSSMNSYENENTASLDINDIIAVPDDDYYEEDEDYADNEDQGTDQNMVASIAHTKIAPKADRPEQDDVANIIAEDKQISDFSMAPEDELRQVPNIVFVSGLEKSEETSKIAQLTGKAINFHAVARTY